MANSDVILKYSFVMNKNLLRNFFEKNQNIKKVQTVENGLVILLDNGDLYSFGDNSSGNLGQKRSFLEMHNYAHDFSLVID